MRRIKVAIIDNGVYDSSVTQYIVTKENIVTPIRDDRTIMNHGTECYDIFSYICSNAECISIQAGEEDSMGRMKSERLIAALYWCLEHEVKLVSLSIGTSSITEFKQYNKVLEQLIEHNIIVVAAVNNKNKITYPASKKGIIGVRYDKEHQLPAGQYAFLENEMLGTDVVVHTRLSEELHKEIGEPEHNSFAVPYMAGIICNVMNEQFINGHVLTIPEVNLWLKENALVVDNQFSMEYYNKLTYTLLEQEPIQVAVVLENMQLEQLVCCFREQGYAVVELTTENKINWTCKEFELELKHSMKQYQVFSRIVEADMIFWYVGISNVTDEMKDFFDVVVARNEDRKWIENYGMIRDEGQVLFYSQRRLEVETVYQDLCSLLL